MNLLGLDISKTCTGAAIGHADKPPRTLEFKNTSNTYGAIFLAYARWLNDLIVIEKPEAGCFEAAIRKINKDMSAESAYILFNLTGITYMQFEARRISMVRPVEFYQWRKVFLGQSYPADPKEEAKKMCRMLGWEHGASHDRAEAAGVWAYGHWKYGNRKAINNLMGKMKA